LARTVLLADDSVTAQNMGRRILTDAGYEVITVNNGSAALKKIHEKRPDLIVLDVYMPGYGGLEVCQRLKESGETMRIPVLLTVGKMEPFKADEAKRVRADGHIVKPFEASELLAALAKLEDRIVPQDSGKGRKKKPSFWHGGTDETPAGWTDNVAYLAETKQRKASEIPEPELPEVVVEVVQRNRAGDATTPEPAGELPVVADSGSSFSAESEQDANAVPAEMQDTAAVAPPEESSRLERTDSQTPAEDDLRTVAEVTSGPAAGESATAATRWIAQNVALSPEEAALELEEEMRAADVENASAAAPDESQSADSSTRQPDSSESGGATFAAAAAASASGSAAVAGAAIQESAELPHASETAAAWQNWEHIRDAVMSTHATEGIAEKIAQANHPGGTASGPSELRSETSAPNGEGHSQEDVSATLQENSGDENAALSNIVDSVLAELKPKLMQEIAKKLKK
jgi:CheY-like chemotaxis protein